MTDDWQPIDDWEPVEKPAATKREATTKQKVISSVPVRFGKGVVNPLLGANALKDKMLGGAGQFVTSGAGMFPNPVSDWFGKAANAGQTVNNNMKQAIEEARAANGAKPGSTDWAEVAGEVASPANYYLGPARGAGLTQTLASGAAMGGLAPADTREGQNYAAEVLKNAGVGAGTAGVLHGVGRGAKAVANTVSDLLPENRAGLRLLEAAGDDPHSVANALEQGGSGVPGVPFSAAQITQTPEMAALERVSRNNPVTSPSWANFGRQQNSAMYNALNDIVAPATEGAVENARAARDAATSDFRNRAFALANQTDHETPILRQLRIEMASPLGDSAGAQTIAGDLSRSVARESSTNPAGSTYAARKRLTDALQKTAGLNNDELTNAVKSNRVLSSRMVESIDDSLNQASGGWWQHYLDEFGRHSGDVNNLQALNNIRADLAEQVRKGATNGGAPVLTRARIAQIIEDHATNDFGPLIHPQTQGRLDAVRGAAQNIEAAQNNFRAGFGGGSNTAHDIQAAIGSQLLKKLGPVGKGVGLVISPITNAIENQGATRLGQLLQNPVDAANALRSQAGRAATRRASRRGVRPEVLSAVLAGERPFTQ